MSIPKNTFVFVIKKLQLSTNEIFQLFFGAKIQNTKILDQRKLLLVTTKKKLAKRYDTNCCKSFYEEKSFGCNSFLSSMNFVCVMSHFVNHPNICTQ